MNYRTINETTAAGRKIEIQKTGEAVDGKTVFPSLKIARAFLETEVIEEVSRIRALAKVALGKYDTELDEVDGEGRVIKAGTPRKEKDKE